MNAAEFAAVLDTAAERARERARYCGRYGEGAAVTEYHRGRAASFEQVAALLRSTDGAYLARLAELNTPPAYRGGPKQQPPGYSEGPQGREDAAHGLEPLEEFARRFAGQLEPYNYS